MRISSARYDRYDKISFSEIAVAFRPGLSFVLADPGIAVGRRTRCGDPTERLADVVQAVSVGRPRRKAVVQLFEMVPPLPTFRASQSSVPDPIEHSLSFF